MEKKLCAGIGIGKFSKCDGLMLLAEQEDGSIDQNTIIVWHDNGVAGQTGYTEYTLGEISQIGGLDALKSDYASNGVTIRHIN